MDSPRRLFLTTGNLASMADDQRCASRIGSGSGRSLRRRGAQSAEYRAEQTRLAPYEDLARMIIARRIRYGLTQAQLAERMGTSVPAVSRLESGQHRPNLATLEKLARAFRERLVVGLEDEAGTSELAVFDR